MTIQRATRIMVFGTFDYIHEGHKSFFTQARALSEHSFLIVSIARDVNVERIKKKVPLYNENERLLAVTALGMADKVILGSTDNYLAPIIEERPDIIGLGYDQISYTENLERDLAAAGLNCKIIRLEPYYPEKYKSSLFKADIANLDKQ